MDAENLSAELRKRADGFQSRADAIYNGAIIAEELRWWARYVAVDGKPSAPQSEKSDV